MDEPRWIILLPLAFMFGLVMAGEAQWGWVDAWPSAPDWPRVDGLLALALTTAAFVRPGAVWGVMAWCGAMRDLFAGGRPGANILLFMAAGAWWCSWRITGWGMRWLAGVTIAVAAHIARPLLTAPGVWVAYGPRELPALLVSGLMTGLLIPLLAVVMQATGLTTWRKGEMLRG